MTSLAQVRRVAALLAVAALTTPAAAQAAPDTWVRWGSEVPDTTIRSLDFAGPALFAGSDSDGVFGSPSSLGPWARSNGGLDAGTGARSVRQVKAAPSGVLYAATSAGLFSSPAGGGSWTPVGQGPGPGKLTMGGIQSIVFNDPSATDMTVAVAGGAGPGVYTTSDAGSTWSRAAGMPTGENVFSLTPGAAGTTYAAADDGIFASADAGRHWLLLSDGIPPNETALRVAMAPDDPSHLYASTASDVYRSTNGGVTWAEAGGSDGATLPAGGKRAFQLAPALGGKFGPARAVVGTDSGVWATIDDGGHWAEMSATAAPSAPNMGDRVVWSLGLGFSPPSLMAGTAGFGVFSLPLEPVQSGLTGLAPLTGLEPGTELTATPNGWSGTLPIFFTYVWKRCDSPGCTPTTAIPGATGRKFVVPNEDAGKPNVRYAVSIDGRNLVRPGQVTNGSSATTGGVAPSPANKPRPSYASALQPTLTPTANTLPSPQYGTTFTIQPGTWRTEGSSATISPVFKYRWERCGASGCTEIPGATGPAYTTAPGDIGAKVRGSVAGTTAAGGGSAYFLAGVSNTVINRFPASTAAPEVVGDSLVGATLSSSAGGWDGHDMTYERRWLRCEADGTGCNATVPVATGSTYALTAADRGRRLRVEVTAVGADPNQARRTVAVSEPSGLVADPVPPSSGPGPGTAPAPAPPATPRTTRKPKVTIKHPKRLRPGAKLAVPARFAGFKRVTYQWLRNGKRIRKATRRTYVLTRKDRGKRLACRITLRPATGGRRVVVTTKALAVRRR